MSRIEGSNPFLSATEIPLSSLFQYPIYFDRPKCNPRVRFLCRYCQDLVHASSRESVLDREIRKVRKIRRRLGADAALESHLPRPKYMRHAKYERLCEEVFDRERRIMRAMYDTLEALREQVQPPTTSEKFWS